MGLDGGKVSPLDLHLRIARSAEKAVDEGKDQFAFDDQEGPATQRTHPNDMHACRDRQRLQKFPKFDHFDVLRTDVDDPSQIA